MPCCVPAGKVRMKDPDEIFWNVTCYGGDIQNPHEKQGPEVDNDFIKSLDLPRWVCFGREVFPVVFLSKD